MKATQYSTQFQMHEQRGTFCGVDTCSLTKFGRYDFTSSLLADAESNTIVNRPDINALLTQFVEEGKMTQCIANSRREEAVQQSVGVDFDAAIRGATYVPMDIARRFEQQLQNNDKFTKVIIDQRENGAPEYTLDTKLPWPICLYPCQKTNKFGAMFCSLPNLTLRRGHQAGPMGSINLWKMVTMLSSIQELWDIVNAVEFRRSKWHGWLLNYIGNNCFPSMMRRASRSNPFSYQQISTVERVVDKTSFIDKQLQDLFIDFDDVTVSESLELSADDITDNTDFIIIDSIDDFDRSVQPTQLKIFP